MASVYVTRSNAEVSLDGGRLLVHKDGERLLDLALRRISSVVCFGWTHVTTPALHTLLENGIDLAYLSRKGRYRGRLTAPCSKNIYLRLAQYDSARNERRCLELAKLIVSSKIGNSRNVLRKFQYNHPSKELTEVIRKLEKLEKLVQGTQEPTRLLGLEGVCSRLYFSLFDQMLRCDLRFTRRSTRPPRNEVNALLSLTYVLVMNELISIVEGMGFDPYLGFFHSVGYGKPSLALDLMEPFRSALCDVFVVRLCNLKILEKDDFSRAPEDEGFRLTEEGLRKYLEEYERRMVREFSHPVTYKRVTWRDCLRAEAEMARNTLMKGTAYSPFQSRV
ncbi:MAG: CRISPR-associated endonuclease Cas1 [bacterium]|nr:CRISPR-associated endonuclease Cas1 [bacterium]